MNAEQAHAQIYEHIKSQALEILDSGESVYPLILVPTTEALQVIKSPLATEPDPQRARDLTRGLLAKLAEVAPCFFTVNEIWTASAIDGDDRPPSDREDRKECLMVQAYSGGTVQCIAMMPFERNGKTVKREKDWQETGTDRTHYMTTADSIFPEGEA